MVKLFSKNSNLCDHNPPTSQTDRQTYRKTTCDGNTALCTKVHRAVKISPIIKNLITESAQSNDVNLSLVLCEYSKFQIESNSYYSIRFDSKRAHIQNLFLNTYCHQFLTYLTEWRRFFTLATVPSNQQNQQTWSRLLAHYGPPSTETPTTETTTVRCHKNSWIYLTSTY